MFPIQDKNPVLPFFFAFLGAIIFTTPVGANNPENHPQGPRDATSSKYEYKFNNFEKNQEFNEFLIDTQNRILVIRKELDARKDELQNLQGAERKRVTKNREKIEDLVQKVELDIKELQQKEKVKNWPDKRKGMDEHLDQAESLLDNAKVNSQTS